MLEDKIRLSEFKVLIIFNDSLIRQHLILANKRELEESYKIEDFSRQKEMGGARTLY